MKDIHVMLQDEIDSRLDALAAASSTKKSVLVREAVAEYVTRKEQERIADEMRQYAKEMAPLSGSFVAETRDHVAEVLDRETSW